MRTGDYGDGPVLLFMERDQEWMVDADKSSHLLKSQVHMIAGELNRIQDIGRVVTEPRAISQLAHHQGICVR